MTLTQKELDVLRFIEKRRKFARINFFEPYDKQKRFFDLGALKRERLLIAANQVGKTESGAFETALHLTGNYPDWWRGRRWDRPVRGWTAGVSSVNVRDTQQRKLCGTPGVPEDFGTGLIPKDAFIDKPSLSRGVTDAYDTIQVRHKSGGVSILIFKSYEQGRTKFQSDTCDFVWLDEEGPMEIYSECLTRITATAGMVLSTYTPLEGDTELTNRFLKETSDDRAHVTMTIYDAKHIPDDEREKIIAGYPAHEREARAMGVPMRGSGRVYPFSDEQMTEPPFREIPIYWAKLWGVDFGLSQNTTDHAFGALLGCWDRDNDVIHIHNEIKLYGQMPLNHVFAMKQLGAAVPVAWPHDGHKTSAGDSGETIATAAIYRKLGLRMLHKHSTFLEGGYSVEAGVTAVTHLITTGKLKISKNCVQLLEELRGYYRKDGLIVAKQDDLLSCLRQIVMMKRMAQSVPLGPEKKGANKQTIADDIDFDIFG